ncbi:MAG: S1 RNA-binding domain-containing protein [Candidatus Krumholzibacteriota bacterium]|nr:S1 RNA-binding domain-containing protein [Candidatus Krumholzibacteriota bacterium]
MISFPALSMRRAVFGVIRRGSDYVLKAYEEAEQRPALYRIAIRLRLARIGAVLFPASRLPTIIFDNLDRTRKLRAKLMLQIVQSYYSEERLVQVFSKNEDGDDVQEEVALNQRVSIFDPETQEAVDEIQNDLTLGEYSIAINSVPRRDTYDEVLFDQLIQMRENGVQIPDHVLIENSQLSDSKEIAEIVKGIQEESGATIEIEDDGTVRVIAVNAESAEIALERIKQITAEPEVGAIYEGEVKSILNFGAFVEIIPGKDGLLHISEISHHRIDKVEDELSVGDIVKVKVLEVNGGGKVRLSRRALLDPPADGDGGQRGGDRGDRDRDRSGDRGGRRRPKENSRRG